MCRHLFWYHVLPRHVMACRVRSCPVISSSVFSSFLASCRIVSCHFMSCHVPCCVTPDYSHVKETRELVRMWWRFVQSLRSRAETILRHSFSQICKIDPTFLHTLPYPAICVVHNAFKLRATCRLVGLGTNTYTGKRWKSCKGFETKAGPGLYAAS